MADHTVAIDVIDISIPKENHKNIAIINQPNPCYGYNANAKEVWQLIQISRYYVYEAGTKNIINGDNYYDYFPEEGGGGGGGGVTPEEVAAMIANSIDSSVSTTSTNAVQNAAMTNFVNSSIESSTGQFRGTFESTAEMDLVEGSKNDYAFLVVRNPDDTVNHYERYKWVIDTTVEPAVGSWEYEYDVNNSSFTAEQWAAINSGVKSSDVSQIGTNQLEITKIKADLSKVGATFRGIFNTEQAMDAVAADKNDTAILQSTDANGNEIYSMYSRVEIPQVVPEGYTQLMYISSNGTQYIDTGVQAKRDLKSYIKFTRNSYSSGCYIGARDTAGRYELRFDNWSGRFYCDIGNTNINIPSESGSISEIVIEYPTVTVDDTVFNFSTQSDFTLEKNIYLCASNGNSSKGTISLYECIIYDDDKTTELKHFYPCKNSSNVCGMYDVVEGVFYPDANGGNFTAGPQANGYWIAQYSFANNVLTSTQIAALNSGITSSDKTQIGTNTNDISSLNTNKLDKTGTAAKATADSAGNNIIATYAKKTDLNDLICTFRGIFNTQQAMDAVAADKNDTAILQTTDANGNTIYTMESYVTVEPAGNLPEGYTQLLYIESSGTQYIDTGVNLSSSRGFYLKFMPLAIENNTAFFGLQGYDSRNYSTTYELAVRNYEIAFIFSSSTSVDIAVNEISEIDFKPLTLAVNDTVTTVPDPDNWYFSGNNTAALFGYKYNGSGIYGKSSMRLYECKMYDNDNTTLLRHFIPVRNSNNEVGLYDVVEGAFYSNQGSGSFTAGPSADGYWVTQYSFIASIQGSLDAINTILEGVL